MVVNSVRQYGYEFMAKGKFIFKVEGLPELVNFMDAYVYWFMVRGKFAVK